MHRHLNVIKGAMQLYVKRIVLCLLTACEQACSQAVSKAV